MEKKRSLFDQLMHHRYNEKVFTTSLKQLRLELARMQIRGDDLLREDVDREMEVYKLEVQLSEVI